MNKEVEMRLLERLEEIVKLLEKIANCVENIPTD